MDEFSGAVKGVVRKKNCNQAREAGESEAVCAFFDRKQEKPTENIGRYKSLIQRIRKLDAERQLMQYFEEDAIDSKREQDIIARVTSHCLIKFLSYDNLLKTVNVTSCLRPYLNAHCRKWKQRAKEFAKDEVWSCSLSDLHCNLNPTLMDNPNWKVPSKDSAYVYWVLLKAGPSVEIFNKTILEGLHERAYKV